MLVCTTAARLMAANPLIPTVYSADPSAHVWLGDDRLWLNCSHDQPGTPSSRPSLENATRALLRQRRSSIWRRQRAALQVLLAFALLSAARVGAAPDPVGAVNVFTGTSNSRWMLFPGATLPFGLVKLSPDNQTNVWNGGYEYTVGSISGFSHLHAFCLSGVSLMPMTGPIEYNPGLFRVFPGAPDGPFGSMWTSGYRSRIDKTTEHGAPGYYSVELLDYHVKAELTATMRCGAMRFTYPATDEAHLLLDFAFPTEELCRIIEASATQTGPNEIAGHIRQSNNYTGEYTVHFVIRTDKPLASLDAWQRDPYIGNTTNYGTDWRAPVHYQRSVRTFTGHDACGVVLNFHTTAGNGLNIGFAGLQGLSSRTKQFSSQCERFVRVSIVPDCGDHVDGCFLFRDLRSCHADAPLADVQRVGHPENHMRIRASRVICMCDSLVERKFRLVGRQVEGFPDTVFDQPEMLRETHEIKRVGVDRQYGGVVIWS